MSEVNLVVIGGEMSLNSICFVLIDELELGGLDIGYIRWVDRGEEFGKSR